MKLLALLPARLRNLRFSIGLRLTLAFGMIVLLIFLGSILSIRQLNRMNTQMQNLVQIEHQANSILRVHFDLWNFYERMHQAVTSRNTGRFVSEVMAFQSTVDSDMHRARQSLLISPGSNTQAIRVLDAIQGSLNEQVDQMLRLVSDGDWPGVEERLEQQLLGVNRASQSLVDEILMDVSSAQSLALVQMERARRDTILTLWLTTLVSLLISSWLGLQIMGSVARPLGVLTQATRQVASGNLLVKVRVDTQDEIGTLAAAFNDLTWQLRQMFDGLQHTVNDLTRMGEALRESEARFRRLAENAPDLIFRYRIHPTSGFEYVSPASEKMTGYTPEEHYNDPLLVSKIVHPDDLPRFELLMQDPLHLPQPLVARWICKDGRVIWTEQRNVVVCDDRSHPVAFEGIVRDITERMEAQVALQRQLRRLGALRYIDQAISAGNDLQTTLHILLEQVVQQLGADAADLRLYSQDANRAEALRLEFYASFGFQGAVEPDDRKCLDDDLVRRVMQRRRLYSVINIDETICCQGEAFHAYHILPLAIQDEARGVLEVFHRQPFIPDQEWVNFLETLAGQAGIAINAAQMWYELQRSNLDLTHAYQATLEGWVRALDLRDKETEGHTQRVTQVALRLADALGVDETQKMHLYRGALLHDIGKMGIPDRILLKPGPLTQEELAIIQRHPQYAYDFLAGIQFLQPALVVPYYHHEKWDGSGYPHGLCGENIPYLARIFAVVDVWDALRTDRPYRKAWPDAQVRQFLSLQAGKHFDPQIVKTFLQITDALDEEPAAAAA